MTTYPRPDDPTTAFTRADGTTKGHDEDHGRVIEIWENVLHHGAVGDGVTDDTAAFQAAIDTGRAVYVPKPSAGYLISDQLVISKTYGLTMFGDFYPGTGFPIYCNNFPANTDLFKSPDTGFPILRLENLFFYHTPGQGNAPRDGWRMTNSDQQNINWRNVQFYYFDGFSLNVPVGMELVSANLFNVHTIFCGQAGTGGGMFIAASTATYMDHCRWAGNAGSYDLSLAAGGGATLINPIFDGYTPTTNFDRLIISGSGISIINPYVEWTTPALATPNLTLRDIVVDGASYLTIINGQGDVSPANLNGGDLTAVDITSGSNINLLGVPFAGWGGLGTYHLKVANCTTLYCDTLDGLSYLSIDSASLPYATIKRAGQTMIMPGATSTSVSGAAPSTSGCRIVQVSNAGATNMTSLDSGGGSATQEVILYFADGNTTLKHGAGGTYPFSLQGGVDYNPAAGTWMRFLLISSVWREAAR